MPDSQSHARLPCPIHDDDSGRRRAENSATRWSRCDSYMLTQHNRDEVTAELLGIDAAAIHTAVSDLPAGSDNRALVIALGLVLGHWKPARTPGATPLRPASPVVGASLCQETCVRRL
jgi:hypothetical protein